jgi:hypothetical protein
VEGHIGFAYLVRKRILAKSNISVNAKDLGMSMEEDPQD